MKPLTTLVAPGHLLEHLEDPNWAVVDCRFDLHDPGWGHAAYLQAHIPGAVYAHLEDDLSAPRSGTNGRHPLPSPRSLSGVLSRWGIDEQMQVVVYDIGPDFFASRLWWTLRYLGHHAVAVLDGGFQAWLQMGYPTRAGEEHRVPKTFIARPRPEMLVTTDAVPAVRRLIDARAPERYRGETEPIDPVAGHIPGAVNYDWKNSLDATGRMLAPEVLRQRLGHVLGDMPPSAAAVYCGSGVSSCHVLLAMAVAGLDGARLYAGSWSEWCSNPSRPFDQGAG